MTDEQLEHFRDKLRRERSALDRRILASQEQAQRAIDPLATTDERDARGEAADDALHVGTMRTLQEHEIDGALQRIEDGSYGTCEECGRPIEVERLEAVPWTRLCEDDARAADRSRPPQL
ncbi:MAG: TraR/DksA C4-type zinc finger protein [Thermodesulfobacteriota bacterium]